MVGTVKELRGNSFNVAGTASFANGDERRTVEAGEQVIDFAI